jgi:hypothetical protein
MGSTPIVSVYDVCTKLVCANMAVNEPSSGSSACSSSAHLNLSQSQAHLLESRAHDEF